MDVMNVYNLLLKQHGKQRWWPCRTGRKFEVCVGAILTQNTNWGNVEKALSNLINANCMSAEKISFMDTIRLQSLIRPSGFFRQKTRRLKILSEFILNFGGMKKFLRDVTREELLSINGIGPETADSILLYACNKPYFVADAYTRRMFSALKMTNTNDYEQLRNFFESEIPRDAGLYKEFHALIVVHAKGCCGGFVRDGCVLNALKQAQHKYGKRIARE